MSLREYDIILWSASGFTDCRTKFCGGVNYKTQKATAINRSGLLYNYPRGCA